MAGVDVGTAYLTVVPSAKGFAGNLQRQLGGGMESAGKSAGSEAAKGFGSSFKSGISTVAKAGALLLGGIAAGGVAFVKDSISEARESQKVGALTTQVIKTTGSAAKVSAAQVGDLATAISNKTGIDDEAIQSGANLLLTFTGIRNEAGKGNDVFNQTTQVVTDMSAALGQDMKSSAIQVGKALNDPVKGITALQRVGVSFTEQQKSQINTLVKSGKTLDAQKLILAELNKEFGGSAAAAATNGEKLATAFGNFKEGIGTSLLPFLDKAEGLIANKLLPGVQGLIDILFKGDFTKAFGEAFNLEEDSKTVAFLFKIRDAFGAIKTAVSDFIAGFTLKDDVGVPLEGFVAVGQKARTMALALFGYLKEVLPPIWESAKNLWPSIKEIGAQLAAASASGGVSTFGLLKDALAALPGILNAIAPVLENVAKWMGENKDVVSALVVALGAGVATFRVITTVVKTYTAIQAALNVVLAANPIGLIVIAVAALAAGLIYAYQNSETFRNVVDTAFKAIGAAASFMWHTMVAPIIRFLLLGFAGVTDNIGNMLDALSNIPGFGWAKDAANKMHGAANKAQELADKINGIPDQKNIRVRTEFVTVGNPPPLPVNSPAFFESKWLKPAGMRAGGGPVSAGRSYIVGEREPELFVPNTSGRIMNQSQIAAAAADGVTLSAKSIADLARAIQGAPAPQVSVSQIDRGLAWRA